MRRNFGYNNAVKAYAFNGPKDKGPTPNTAFGDGSKPFAEGSSWTETWAPYTGKTIPRSNQPKATLASGTYRSLYSNGWQFVAIMDDHTVKVFDATFVELTGEIYPTSLPNASALSTDSVYIYQGLTTGAIKQHDLLFDELDTVVTLPHGVQALWSGMNLNYALDNHTTQTLYSIDVANKQYTSIPIYQGNYVDFFVCEETIVLCTATGMLVALDRANLIAAPLWTYDLGVTPCGMYYDLSRTLLVLSTTGEVYQLQLSPPLQPPSN